MRMMMLAAVVAMAGCAQTQTVAVVTDPVAVRPVTVQPVAVQPVTVRIAPVRVVGTSNATAYQRYKMAREAALTGKAPAPRTIPIALPAKAPTPAEIAPQKVVKPRVVVTTTTAARWPRQPVSPAAHARACGRFYTAQAAQDAFVRAGGPQADPGGLDPDGDGYACTARPASGL